MPGAPAGNYGAFNDMSSLIPCIRKERHASLTVSEASTVGSCDRRPRLEGINPDIKLCCGLAAESGLALFDAAAALDLTQEIHVARNISCENLSV